MKKLLHLLLVTCALYVLVGCEKDQPTEPEDQLPPITMTGAMTAGCIINRQVTIPKNGSNPLSGHVVFGLSGAIGPNFKAPNYNDYIGTEISNLKNRGNKYSIYIQMHSLRSGAGDYVIGQAASEEYINFPFNPQIIVRELTNNTTTGKVFLSSPNSGIIKVTRFDNGVFSATFSATLYNRSNPTETIKVTDGRFDKRYSQI